RGRLFPAPGRGHRDRAGPLPSRPAEDRGRRHGRQAARRGGAGAGDPGGARARRRRGAGGAARGGRARGALGRVRPYPATLPTLTTLRERGIPLGLVSDCTALMGRAILERVELLPYLDAVALSYEVGRAKPEAAIYRVAVDGLGVPPENCLYVGDGGSDELTGAAALGMTTVRIDQEGGFGRTAYPTPSDDVIVSLHELLDLPL